MTLKEYFKQRLMNALVESSEEEAHREARRVRTSWPMTDYYEKKPYPPGTLTDVTEIEPLAHVPDETKTSPPGFVKGSQGRTLRERGVKIAKPETDPLIIPQLITAPFEYWGRKLGNTLQRAIGRPETYHKHVPLSASDIRPQD